MLDDLRHDPARQACRDREADALIAARAAEDRGVDPHDLAGGVDQRPAGVAGVDGGVGLDEVLESGDAEVAAAGGADDAERDRLTHPEGVADREHHVAHGERFGVPERDGRQRVEVDLEHRQIALGVGADLRGPHVAAVEQRDPDLVGAFDDVVVGEDVAVLAHDHAGAQAGLQAPARGAELLAEEAPEQRVVHERGDPLGDHLGAVDVDHRRGRPLHGVGVGQRHGSARSRLVGRGARGLAQLHHGPRLLEHARRDEEHDESSGQPGRDRLKEEAGEVARRHGRSFNGLASRGRRNPITSPRACQRGQRLLDLWRGAVHPMRF